MIFPLIHLILIAIAVSLALIFTYRAVLEKDLVKAVAFSAAQSTAFALVFYLLAAPDIVLAYVAIAVGIYTAIILFLIRKTESYEEV